MKKRVFLAFAIAGFYIPFLVGQTIVNDVATLQSAIAAATEGEVIQLSPSFPSVLPSTITMNITHTNNFVVDGNGQTLEIGGSFLHFSITKTTPTGSFTLRNMELKGLRTDANGTSGGPTGGGVIVNANSQGNVVFDHVNFNSIESMGDNGALRCTGLNASALTRVLNCTFRNNHKGTHGGAIYHGLTGSLEISDCTFDQNYCVGPGYSGGAITSQLHTGQLTIRRTVFLNNSSYDWGGAVSIYTPNGGASAVSIDSCYFEGNRTTGLTGNADGAGISVHGNSPQMTKFDLRNSTFYNNHAADDGGAVYLQNAGAGAVNTITNCTMTENSGGDANPAVYSLLGTNINIATCGGGMQFSLKTPVTLEHNTIVQNYTTTTFDRPGGGLGFHASMSGAPVVTLTNNIIVGNYWLKGGVKTEGRYSNVGFQVLVNPQVTLNGKNLGYDNYVNDASVPANVADETMMNVFGTEEPLEWDNYATAKVGNPYETNDDYYRVIPTVSIKPNDGDVLGVADGTCTSALTMDERGFLRDQPLADVGAIEIKWAKFDANGGEWASMPDLVYDGTEYYEKDSITDSVQAIYMVTPYNGSASAPQEEPTLTDQIFQYWALDDVSGPAWDGSPLTLTADRTLYAIWATKPLEIAFENDTVCPSDLADLTQLTPADSIDLTGLTLAYYTDPLCTVPVADPQAVEVGTYYIAGTDVLLSKSDTVSVTIVEREDVEVVLTYVGDVYCFGTAIDSLALEISDASHAIIPGTGVWILGKDTIIPETYKLSYTDYGKMLYYQIETKCGIVRSNMIEVEICHDTPEINRPVFVPEVEGIETSVEPGMHYVFGHDDFEFTITPLPGYSLDGVTVTTNKTAWNELGGIEVTRIAEDTIRVFLKDITVTYPLEVIIEGVRPTSNISIENASVWTNGEQLFIRPEKEMMLSVYTITGSLYTQQRVSAGETVMTLPSGVYIVVLDGKTYLKAAIR